MSLDTPQVDPPPPTGLICGGVVHHIALEREAIRTLHFRIKSCLRRSVGLSSDQAINVRAYIRGPMRDTEQFIGFRKALENAKISVTVTRGAEGALFDLRPFLSGWKTTNRPEEDQSEVADQTGSNNLHQALLRRVHRHDSWLAWEVHVNHDRQLSVFSDSLVVAQLLQVVGSKRDDGRMNAFVCPRKHLEKYGRAALKFLETATAVKLYSPTDDELESMFPTKKVWAAPKVGGGF